MGGACEVAESNNFILMPKIDFLGNMTPSVNRKEFPRKVGAAGEREGS